MRFPASCIWGPVPQNCGNSPAITLKISQHIWTMAHFKLTTLVDNTVYGHVLQAEHGLSVCIEGPDFRLLFDTGQSDLWAHNASVLGIGPDSFDGLVLSHGHYDHTGGLRTFMQLNPNARIYCKRAALDHKFKRTEENGICHPEELDLSRLVFVDKLTEIFPGVRLHPELPVTDETDTHFRHFNTAPNVLPGEQRRTDMECHPDTFEDELVLSLEHDDFYSVISACSHRGITHILEAVRSYYTDRTLHSVIGGFHIHRTGETGYQPIARYLRMHTPQRLVIGHCTGVDQYARFCRDFDTLADFNHVGKVLEL